jgi:hypothetical protein
MEEPRKYIDMVIEANEFADSQIQDKESVSWVQTRDSWLKSLCFFEINNHLDTIYKKQKSIK